MDQARPKIAESGFFYELIKVLLIVVITSFVYSNTLGNQFVFDDSRIYLNPHIRLNTLSFPALTRAWQESEPRTRPVANVSFALNYFFHQNEVTGYHIVNIAVHALTGVFLFFLIKTTLSLPSMRPRYRSVEWLSFFSVLLWLVHPVQTQSVTYLVQRMNSMAGMFYVIALFSYVKGRLSAKWWLKVVFFGCAAGGGLMSLWSKEIALTLPIFIVLYDWYFLQDLKCIWPKKYGFFVGASLALLMLAAFFFYYGKDPFLNLLAGYDLRDFSLIERLLTESRVVLFYLSLLLLPSPSRLNLDHDFAVSQSLLFPPTTAISLFALSLMLGVAVFTARRHRLLSFGIIWFLGHLAIESSFIPLEIIFEHRLYLPSMMLILALVAFVKEHSVNNHVNLVVVVSLAMLLSFWTYQRNQIWSNAVTLWGDCVKKSPEKARVHSNLGVALKKMGRLDDAEFHFRETVRLDQSFFEAYNSLGNIMFMRGRLDKAIGFYGDAILLKPNNALLHVNLGNVLMDSWRVDEAKNHYKKALWLQPWNVNARENLFRANKVIQFQQRGLDK